MAHILIVDDDAQIRATMSEFLGKLGHDVAVAANGREAVKQLAASKVDLMLLDIIMPEQDGIGTILEIMHLPERPVIIVISGGSRSLDTAFIQSITAKLPVAEFLQKPVNLNVLGAAIEKALAAPAAY